MRGGGTGEGSVRWHLATQLLEPSQDVRDRYARLDAAERAGFLRLALDELTGDGPGIQKTPGVCGGSACVRRTRIPVWLLEEGRRSGATDLDFLQSYAGLTATDLVRAWGYVAANSQEIEDELRRQEEA